MKSGYIKVRNDLVPGQKYGKLTMFPGHMSNTLIGQVRKGYPYNGRDGCFEDHITGYILSGQMVEEYFTDEQLHIQNRIAKLKKNPVENAKIIKKWERKLRKAV